MPLDEQQKQQMKERRILLYESRTFELEMDAEAARAVGDDEHADRINEDIAKMQAAILAVAKM